MDRREFSRMMAIAGAGSALLRKTAWSQTAAPGVKFSVMLWIMGRNSTMEQRLETIAAAGYQGAEMVDEWMKWSTEDRKRIVAKKNALGLTFDVMFPSLTTLVDPEQRTKLKQEIAAAIPIAQEIGCRQFAMKSGARIAGQSPEQGRQSIADGLKVAADVCRDAKIEVLLEPIDVLEDKRQFVNSVVDGFAIVRSVNDPGIKVLYDFYHEQRGTGNLIDTLEKNADLVGLVHIADVPGRRRPGTGEMNYDNIYRKLAAVKYNRYIAMEFYFQGDAVAELKAAKAEALTAMQSA
ncbi:hydroxypyruvate isomerase [Terriglobus roseus DSM 18391]|uniref:Hydroxypyruvate isomerase n=1 Tax=Terriglobus roseus (strain DSM 18391 / NRRL B-41598 / KBS 63) TaxID=926566 RepID=I3ZLW4_TERRK|nr:TIM barrel protein [Terriglobus roseus]AFL90232.1 hydroxypyruvate isomerase [Terriglobus roseus DSM 18391]